MKLYVEGGGDAYDSFCTAIANDEDAMLLVDSEALVIAIAQPGNADHQEDRKQWLPWQHLRQREGDGWEKPVQSNDRQCHFMAQCMESWFLTDKEALKVFFGQGFNQNSLPRTFHIEQVPKNEVYESLARASANCRTKSKYGKSEHSFKLLALIDPEKVQQASPWALRLIETLRNWPE